MLTAPSFQQLVAIPMDQYSQMVNVTNTVQQQPLGQKLVQLQRELTSSITSPPQSLTTTAAVPNHYDRMMRQGMLLEEMKRTKEQLKADISLGTPKPYRNRALALYHQIAPVTHFNEKGELVLTDDDDNNHAERPITGSRAEDLIQHAIRDRRKQFTPTGWPEFVSQLLKHNIPRMMLNRATIEELNALSTKQTPPIHPTKQASPIRSTTTKAKRKAAQQELTASGGRKKSKRLRKTPAKFLQDFEV